VLHDIPVWPPGAEERFRAPQLSERPFLHDGAEVYRSRLGSWTEIGRGSLIVESEVGDYTYCDSETSLIYSTVGRFCSIAARVRINPGNHPMGRVSQHHLTYRLRQYGLAEQDDEEFFQWRRNHPCTIGHDVWLGHQVVVLPGVSIGTGAVVGAGAVVTRDVEPYSVVVGIPARPVKKRFADSVIRRLLASAWWDWDHDRLKERWRDLCDLEVFLQRYCPS
jgi:phosphonate metabolism protein (transferase hexapeptide repeat family)